MFGDLLWWPIIGAKQEEESPLYLDIWINERKSGLGGGDIFQNRLERNRISPSILHTRENPGCIFLKEVTYAKYENGLKILTWWEFWLNRFFSWVGVGVWGHCPLIFCIFWKLSTSKPMFPMGYFHWKMKPIPPTEKQTPTNEKWSPFQEMVRRKRTRKIGNCINLCFTHKITLGKDGRNSTKMWFSHLKHSKCLKKKKTMVSKSNPLMKCKGPP